ncbi:MAG: hypothetical protein AB4041_16595 [Microcystaceae cyanobacterium]
MTNNIKDNSDRSVTLTVKGLIQPNTSSTSIRTLTIPYHAFSRTLQWVQRQGGRILEIEIQASPFMAESKVNKQNNPMLWEDIPKQNHLQEEATHQSVDDISRLLSLNLDTEKYISLSSRRNRRKIKTNRRKVSPVYPSLHRRRKRRR